MTTLLDHFDNRTATGAHSTATDAITPAQRLQGGDHRVLAAAARHDRPVHPRRQPPLLGRPQIRERPRPQPGVDEQAARGVGAVARQLPVGLVAALVGGGIGMPGDGDFDNPGRSGAAGGAFPLYCLPQLCLRLPVWSAQDGPGSTPDEKVQPLL